MAFKGFTRYWRDPVFKAAIDDQLAQAKAVWRPGVFITYAIHDPTRVDHIEGRPEGLIVYVGQTKQFGIRVKDRLVSAGKAVRRPLDQIDGFLYDIMKRGPVPRWTVLEEVSTAVDSLASETNWIKRLLEAGYPLHNKWSEHKFAGLETDRYGVPHKRLWAMTTEDAIGSEIDLIIQDVESGEEQIVDLSIFPPSTRLQKIKAGQPPGRRARLHVR